LNTISHSKMANPAMPTIEMILDCGPRSIASRSCSDVGYEPSAHRVVAARTFFMYGPAIALIAPDVTSRTPIAAQIHQPCENHLPSIPAITPKTTTAPSETYIGVLAMRDCSARSKTFSRSGSPGSSPKSAHICTPWNSRNSATETTCRKTHRSYIARRVPGADVRRVRVAL
jgi:hypothetical protein